VLSDDGDWIPDQLRGMHFSPLKLAPKFTVRKGQPPNLLSFFHCPQETLDTLKTI
jgi:hypothetical protein